LLWKDDDLFNYYKHTQSSEEEALNMRLTLTEKCAECVEVQIEYHVVITSVWVLYGERNDDNLSPKG